MLLIGVCPWRQDPGDASFFLIRSDASSSSSVTRKGQKLCFFISIFLMSLVFFHVNKLDGSIGGVLR